MNVKYIYSACLEIDCNGFKILTDPWFTDGAYDGSWYKFPVVNAFDHISKPDLIYISHIHPDHYDPVFLKDLISKFGQIDIVIPDINPNYLLLKGKADGIELIPTKHIKNEFVEIFIEENDTGSISDIDSALIIKDLHSNEVLLNLNDCIYNQTHIDKLKSIINSIGNQVDLLALGYTGAGPYPQTYFDTDKEKDKLIFEADKKKSAFFDRYKQFIENFNSSYNLPFAGEYILGGKLHHLNQYRGVADAFEIKSFDDNAVILSPGGQINISTEEVLGERDSYHSKDELLDRINAVKGNLYDYEKEVKLAIEKINFPRLLKQAASKASSKSEIEGEYHFIFSILDLDDSVKFRYVLNTSTNSIELIRPEEDLKFDEFSEIFIDYRHLFGLLTTIYHWNNAEVGSHYFTKRKPYNNYRNDVQTYLNFFSIA